MVPHPTRSELYLNQKATVQTVKTGNGLLRGWFVYNPNAAATYVQLFFTAAAVTLGTTVPDLSFGLPATAAANLLDEQGIAFTGALQFALTTTENGSTAPTTGCTVNIFYR
jgi:hypothetical protein